MNIKQNILQTIRVLFVGNSLIIRNNLPNMLQMMILKKGLLQGQTVAISSIAKPAASFNTFASSNDYAGGTVGDFVAYKMLIESPNAWTHVVLQEQSDKLSLGLPFERNYVWPAALKLSSYVNSNKPTKLLWYETMAHSGGNKINDTYELMQDRIITGYSNLNEIVKKTYPELNTTICPVGKVWNRVFKELIIMKKNPVKILYIDSVHPTVSGTYLSSLVFYKIITSRKARYIGLSYKPKGVSNWFVRIAQRLVDDEIK